MTTRMYWLTAVSALLFSSSALASSIRTTVGADAWFGDTKIDEQRRDHATAANLFVAIEHDQPYLPYASLRYTSIDADYAGFDKYDFSFYYRVLEREHMLFDAGVSLTKYSDSHYRTSISPQPSYSFNELTFNWYAYAELSIPNTDFDIIGQFDFGNSKDIKRADVLAGVQYQASDTVAIRAGYRVVDLEFDDLANETPEVSESLIFVDGFFVGAEFRF